jgi:cell division protease FtsH
MQDLEDAKDKVMMGSERRSMVMSDEEKKLTAYHEAGHAVATLHSPASDPIHKATIIPRGRALGMVMRLPEKDEYSMARDKLEANLVVAMGGRIAEEMMFGHAKVTTGASGDISMATKLARRMVTEWGMSEKLGPLRYNDDQEEVFLGHSVTQTKNVSAATAELIDVEVRRIVDDAYSACEKILTENRKELELLGEALLEYETLSGDEIKSVVAGETIVRGDDDAPTGQAKSSIPTAGNIGITPDPKPQPGS